MSTFRDLKNGRAASLKAISEQVKNQTKKSFEDKDDRLWYPRDLDDEGNGFAIIRFLPPHESEDIPYVRLYEHSFQGPTGRWYIEKCLSTKEESDPVLEYNSKLWNSNSETLKDQARKQKRKTSYYANIYVIKDTMDPSNEGKVMIYKFGPKIFEKINSAMHPPKGSPDDPFNPFDLWDGANFRVSICTKDKQRNYDQSRFEDPRPLFTVDNKKNGEADDDRMEATWKQVFPLNPFVTEGFKTYDDLKKKLDIVLDLQQDSRGARNRDEEVEEDETIGEIDNDVAKLDEPKKASPKKKSAPEDDEADGFNEEEFFASLSD